MGVTHVRRSALPARSVALLLGMLLLSCSASSTSPSGFGAAVAAFDAVNGQPLWHKDAPGIVMVYPPAEVTGGVVSFRAMQSTDRCSATHARVEVDTATGELTQRSIQPSRTELNVRPSPGSTATWGRLEVIADVNQPSTIRAVDPDTGAEQWSSTLVEPFRSRFAGARWRSVVVAVDANTVYLAASFDERDSSDCGGG